MDTTSNPIDQQESLKDQNIKNIVEDQIQDTNQQNSSPFQQANEADTQNYAMISSQASTVQNETVEQSETQNLNNQLINEISQEKDQIIKELSDIKDTKPADNQLEQISDKDNHIDQIQETNKIIDQPILQSNICSIHEIKNKYVCIQQNCSAASRIACAECHVEGPHPKHELVKIEQFKEVVSVKSSRAIELFKQVNKESAKQRISDLIQKIQDDFISQLNEFKQEKIKQIEAASLIGDDLIQNNNNNNNNNEGIDINYSEILPLFANQQISFSDTSLLNVALILYNSEQNDSIEVSKANFNLFIEDIQTDIHHIERNIQQAFVQRISSSQHFQDEQIRQSRPEGVTAIIKDNQQISLQSDSQNQSLINQDIHILNDHLQKDIHLKQDTKITINQQKKSSQVNQNEAYNWRERREQQRLEEEKLMLQEGNSKIMRKCLQVKLKGECIKKVFDHKGWVGRIERVSDNAFASCSSDKKVFIWDINTMKPIKSWTSEAASKNHILSLCKLDQKTIAMGGSDKLIRIFEWETETMVKILKGHKGGVNFIISLSDEVIASCGSDNSIVVWNWKQEVVLNNLANYHLQTIYQICSLHSNSFLASCSKDTTIKVYNFDTKQVVSLLKGAKQAVHTICYLKKTLLAAGSADQTIRIWNYTQQIQTKIIKVPNQSIYTLCRIDDYYIASGQSDNKIKIWAYEEGQTLENSQDSRHGYGALCVKTLESHTSAVSCLNYFPEKFLLISGSNDHSICLWQ